MIFAVLVHALAPHPLFFETVFFQGAAAADIIGKNESNPRYGIPSWRSARRFDIISNLA